MSVKSIARFCCVPVAALAIAACGGNPEAVVAEDEGADDMALAEDASDGTVADEMDSGAPEIQQGGGMAVGAADNPNEPVIPDDVGADDTDPAEVLPE